MVRRMERVMCRREWKGETRVLIETTMGRWRDADVRREDGREAERTSVTMKRFTK